MTTSLSKYFAFGLGLALTAMANGGGLRAAPLHVDFIYEADKRPLLADSLRYKTEAGETVSFTRLDWLASDFSVTTVDGRTYKFPGVYAYVPTQGGSVSLGEMGAEKVKAISFYVGPDAAANHKDPASFGAGHPLNPEVNNLHWDWQGGYIFMALEGHWRTGEERETGGFSYHFARDQNRTKITLPLNAELRDEARIIVALDPVKLLDGLTIAKDGRSTHSAQGDPVATRLHNNLQHAFRLAGLERGGVPAPANPPLPIDLPPLAKAYAISLPRNIPLPSLPLDNPIIEARVNLGRALFHEPALSRDSVISCVNCHNPAEGFSDSRPLSRGVDDLEGRRQSMPLFNLAWKNTFFWDGRAPSIRAQVLMPIQDHLEMDANLDDVVEKLWLDPRYPALFAEAFGSGDITAANIGLALENYLLTLTSFDSKFDRAMKGQGALSAEEKRGFELFFTEYEPRQGKYGADCFHCHGGALFTDHAFHNNGLRPSQDLGREEVTGKESDRYKFITPSLRNVALTAPYMHDGRIQTLEQVVGHYNRPLRPSETLDPNLAKHPEGLGLSRAEQQAIVAFLKTLNDPKLENGGITAR